MLKLDFKTTLGKDLTEINKSFDDYLYSIARKIRKETAKKILTSDDSQWRKIIVKDGILNSVLERTPFSNTEEILQFNIRITEEACNMVLQSTFTLIEKIGLYANVVELGSREFISPYNIEKVHKNLSAAKDKGYFFTPPSLAVRMVIASINYSSKPENVLDPAAGVGIFLAYHMLLNPELKSVLGIEIDDYTAKLGDRLLNFISNELSRPIKITMMCADFFEAFDERKELLCADLIIMNPPYGALKMLASDLTDISTKASLSQEEMVNLENKLKRKTINRASKLRNQFSSYGIGRGTLEYSKIFMAATIDLLSSGGLLIAITPSSWLGDEASVDFRKNIVSNRWIKELWIIPEKAKFFKGVNQPTVVSILQKKSSLIVKVFNPVLKVDDIEKEPYIFDYKTLVSVSGVKQKFPNCSEVELNLLTKFQHFGKIRDISGLINMRGELDLTEHKEYVSFKETKNRLIRGDHIRGSILLPASSSDKAGFVFLQSFIKTIRNSEKSKYCLGPRIAISQCSYLQKKKRIEAAIVPKGVILANSCNFISIVKPEDSEIALFYYWMILNSSVTEWQFRIFNYNNHVSNKEIDVLTCVSYDDLSDYFKLEIEKFFLKNNFYQRFSPKQDAFIASVYNLKIDEYKIILDRLEYDEIDSYLGEYQNYEKNQ